MGHAGGWQGGGNQPNHTRHLQLCHMYAVGWHTWLGVFDICACAREKAWLKKVPFLFFTDTIVIARREATLANYYVF